ncbi:uncharacterized protein [Primulina huaijiensis]|uniref:uncharacterized protein n=1 Tax=Primulina huaijiensis TaxID=1492673 RepID=UPI003CC753DE
MYAESGRMFPSILNFPQQFDEFGCSHRPNASWGMPCSLIQTPTISDYYLGGAGDLFKAPEPVIEAPSMSLDPMNVTVSMISVVDDSITPQPFVVADNESSIENGQLLDKVFYECERDLLAKEAIEAPLSEIPNIVNIPIMESEAKVIADEELIAGNLLQESSSSSCVRLMESVHEAPPRLNFFDPPVIDFDAACGIRRTFSEGDVKTIGNDKVTFLHSPLGLVKTCVSDARKKQLSRYWNKKSKRNFDRKIKYACRKALADGQPRIRGRFAKPEEIESLKKQ